MNKIEKLLQTLAPDGVGFRKLGEVCEIIRGKRVTKKEILDKGKYPVVSGGIGFMGYLNEYNREENTITIAQYGTAGFVNWQNQKFWANDVCFSVIPNETLINRYLYYVLTNMQNYLYSISNRSAIPYSISSNNIMQITELNTELKARKKQYEYYRNMLLDFNDINQSHKDAKERLAHKTYPKRLKALLQTLAPDGVGFRKLGDIGEYIRGVTYKKNQEINDLECGIKVLRANNITLSNYLNFEEIKVINKNVKIKKEQYLKKNDILICAGSGSSEHIGKVAFINTDLNYVFGGFMGVIRIREVNSRFVYHIFTSNIFKQYLEKSLNTTTINNLNANILQNFLIPIPPLEIQQEIVKILDQFSALTTDLQSGIPAEIELRKKQYEYYREKLLAFKPLNPQKEVKK
ncbi:restriction endonuclease subunit S [Helicobacter pylori]|uniref:Restriction endonuclease subunit S n=1 Tax=Helicobacter pylori TaxID=210 RepID=A0A1A9HCU8_HELPX|nr:restriction endonuclease subunit S [Helicobacter pylori]ANH48294.1 restriction endonuclease subunit S [Helicobacter pylori]